MSRISKFTFEQRLEAVLDYKSGKRKIKEICEDLGVHPSGKVIYQWVSQFEIFGEAAFHQKKHNTQYDKEIKKAAIKDYLAKRGSYNEIARKYNVSSPSIVENWVWKYEIQHGLKEPTKKNIKKTENLMALKKLREENQQLKKELQLKEKENVILKKIEEMKADGRRHKPKYVVIQELHEHHQWSINWMCQVLEVTRAGYYKWLKRTGEKPTIINSSIPKTGMGLGQKIAQ